MPGICIVFPRTVLYSLKNSPVPPKELFQCALKYVYVGSDRVLSTLGRQQWWSSSPQWPILQPVNIKQHFLPFSLKKKSRFLRKKHWALSPFCQSTWRQCRPREWFLFFLSKGLMTGWDLGAFFPETKSLRGNTPQRRVCRLDYTSVYSFSLHFTANISQMFTIVLKPMKTWLQPGMRSAPYVKRLWDSFPHGAKSWHFHASQQIWIKEVGFNQGFSPHAQWVVKSKMTSMRAIWASCPSLGRITENGQDWSPTKPWSK